MKDKANKVATHVTSVYNRGQNNNILGKEEEDHFQMKVCLRDLHLDRCLASWRGQLVAPF